MSWKNVKDHYRIGHIVQVREGKICIGSPYVSDLIRVSFEGEVSWGNLGPSHNDDLARYYAEMTADLPKFRALIEAPDKFAASLPVFTYEGGNILEKQCEQYDWPNVTHDGFLMYENSFSADRSKVIEWAKRNAAAGVELAERRIEEIRKNLAEVEAWRAESAADLAKLESASHHEGGGGGGFENLSPAEEKYNDGSQRRDTAATDDRKTKPA